MTTHSERSIGGRRRTTTGTGLAFLVAALMLMPRGAAGQAGENEPGISGSETQGLRIEKMSAPERAFHVVSSIIVGPTEAILWDGQYKVSDGKRVAERIAATGKRLKAIVLSHADHDHYMGAMEIVERFPGTPVYMTAAGLADFNGRSQRDFAAEKSRGPNPELPERLVEPVLLPSGTLQVDGYQIEVIEGLVGDVRGPASTALWIPSTRTILAGDLVFDGVHPWLGDADKESRIAWRESLRKLKSYQSVAVIPGHKRDLAKPDDPAQIDFMIRYLDDYDAAMETASEPDEVVAVMVDKYPDLALPGLMAYGARNSFKR